MVLLVAPDDVPRVRSLQLILLLALLLANLKAGQTYEMVLSAILGAIRTHIDCTNISYCSASVSRVISRRKKKIVVCSKVWILPFSSTREAFRRSNDFNKRCLHAIPFIESQVIFSASIFFSFGIMVFT